MAIRIIDLRLGLENKKGEQNMDTKFYRAHVMNPDGTIDAIKSGRSEIEIREQIKESIHFEILRPKRDGTPAVRIFECNLIKTISLEKI